MDPGRQIELHERVDRLLGGFEDVEKPVMGAALELLARLLVDVWRAQYRPAIAFGRQRDRTCQLPEGTKMVMPGDNITMLIELITPVGPEEQMRFAIREGGRTVGAGVVTKILA